MASTHKAALLSVRAILCTRGRPRPTVGRHIRFGLYHVDPVRIDRVAVFFFDRCRHLSSPSHLASSSARLRIAKLLFFLGSVRSDLESAGFLAIVTSKVELIDQIGSYTLTYIPITHNDKLLSIGSDVIDSGYYLIITTEAEAK